MSLHHVFSDKCVLYVYIFLQSLEIIKRTQIAKLVLNLDCNKMSGLSASSPWVTTIMGST